ncbi:hypothetical protein Trydic_g23963 [Trypoxylus dichotomus]
MTILNITSGFRATGICTFDNDILPVEVVTPSLLTHRFEALNEEVDSDYDTDDYLTLEALHLKQNTAENSSSEVLPNQI